MRAPETSPPERCRKNMMSGIRTRAHRSSVVMRSMNVGALPRPFVQPSQGQVQFIPTSSPHGGV